MTAKTSEPADACDDEQFRYELADHIDRFIAESLQLWAACENTVCRRAKRCASRDFECIAKWSESLPPVGHHMRPIASLQPRASPVDTELENLHLR